MVPKSAKPTEPGEKRPFRAPKVTVYGKLAKIAQTKAGNKSDGSKPVTRSSGTTG